MHPTVAIHLEGCFLYKLFFLFFSLAPYMFILFSRKHYLACLNTSQFLLEARCFLPHDIFAIFQARFLTVLFSSLAEWTACVRRLRPNPPARLCDSIREY